jgi:hypothetical protein
MKMLSCSPAPHTYQADIDIIFAGNTEKQVKQSNAEI